jgi:hypothetical protein
LWISLNELAKHPFYQRVNESADDLRKLYTDADIDLNTLIVTCCRIGERSSHSWFVLKYPLGAQDVKNFDGWWTEWGNLVGAPIEVGQGRESCASLHSDHVVKRHRHGPAKPGTRVRLVAMVPSEDVQRIRRHPLVPKEIPIYGYIYDAKIGKQVAIPEATAIGRVG